MWRKPAGRYGSKGDGRSVQHWAADLGGRMDSFGLQSDIVWCLGSYGHDKNPVGLMEKSAQALVAFKAELGKKTKGITAKFISDIESALASK